MKYLLDTNIASDLFNKFSENYQSLKRKLHTLDPQEDSIHVSILTLYELEYGLENAPVDKKQELQSKIYKIKSETNIFPLEANGIEYFAKLKAEYREKENLKKEEMGEFNIDLLIASTALVEKAILISSDHIYPILAELNPQFQHENWTL